MSEEQSTMVPDVVAPMAVDLATVRKRMERAQTHTDEVIGALAEIAMSDIQYLLDDDGLWDYNKALATGKTSLIKKLKTRRRFHASGDVTIEQEIEMYSRLDALKVLCDVFGIRGESRRDRAALIFQAAYDLMEEARHAGEALSFAQAVELIRPRLEKAIA